MIVVADASAAVEIALNNTDAEEFGNIIENADMVLAPDIFPSEIVNVFWKYSNYSALSSEKCEKGIDCCLDIVDDYVQTKNLSREVFSESVKYKHPAYDLYYVVIARRNNAYLLSKDRKLIAIAEKMGIRIAGSSA